MVIECSRGSGFAGETPALLKKRLYGRGQVAGGWDSKDYFGLDRWGGGAARVW
jgi:hypothetical protein